MHPVVFPYRKFGGIWCPFVEFGIKGVGGEWLTADAYVDSGASVSVFSANEANRLGLRLNAGALRHAGGVDGKAIPVFVHRLTVQVGPERFPANIGFSDKLGVGFNLLGREDFFSHFDVTFSDTNERMTFQSMKGKPKTGGKGILTAVRRRR